MERERYHDRRSSWWYSAGTWLGYSHSNSNVGGCVRHVHGHRTSACPSSGRAFGRISAVARRRIGSTDQYTRADAGESAGRYACDACAGSSADARNTSAIHASCDTFAGRTSRHARARTGSSTSDWPAGVASPSATSPSTAYRAALTRCGGMRGAQSRVDIL